MSDISHITSPTYYRLLLPALLPDVEKCIYIDGDTIVDGDISKLYAEDLGDNLVAGVKAFAFYRNDINVRNTLGYHKDEDGTGLGLSRVRQLCDEFGAKIRWENEVNSAMPVGLRITFSIGKD